MTWIASLDEGHDVRQPKPLPTEPPFITFLTPTFRRPQNLAKCLRSVAVQTAVEHVEHIVMPDHVGYGIAGGLYGRMAWIAPAVRGKYVHLLCDDDELIEETAVAKVMAYARKHGDPPVIIVGAIKKGFEYPSCDPSDPQPSCVDVGCYILRRDTFLAHVNDYGRRYEGDYDHAVAMAKAGVPLSFFNYDFVEGGANNGRPELNY